MNRISCDQAAADADQRAVRALRTYERSNDNSDLNAAISAARDALAITSDAGRDDNELRVKLLSIGLYFRYMREHNPADMGEIESLNIR